MGKQHTPEERAGAAAQELRELIREAHAAAQELEATRKAARAALDQVPARVTQVMEDSVNAELASFREQTNGMFFDWQKNYEGAFRNFAAQFVGDEGTIPPWLGDVIVSMVNRVSTQIIANEFQNFAREVGEMREGGTSEEVVKSVIVAGAAYAKLNAKMVENKNPLASVPVKYIRFEKAE